MPIFMRAFSSDQNFAVGSIFELFLVYTFWTDNQSNIVDSLKPGKENLGPVGLSSWTILQVLSSNTRDHRSGIHTDYARHMELGSNVSPLLLLFQFFFLEGLAGLPRHLGFVTFLLDCFTASLSLVFQFRSLDGV